MIELANDIASGASFKFNTGVLGRQVNRTHSSSSLTRWMALHRLGSVCDCCRCCHRHNVLLRLLEFNHLMADHAMFHEHSVVPVSHLTNADDNPSMSEVFSWALMKHLI